MGKTTVKNDRPDRIKSPTLSPMATAIQRVFGVLARRSRPKACHGAEPSQPAIRFEPIEPRVLMSGDLNPAQTVSGSIDVPGEVDQYGFTLSQDTKLVFDSLTNNSNITWSLTGPGGTEVSNRSFSSSDSANASGSPLLDLAAGDYTLTVDGTGDATGGV